MSGLDCTEPSRQYENNFLAGRSGSEKQTMMNFQMTRPKEKKKSLARKARRQMPGVPFADENNFQIE